LFHIFPPAALIAIIETINDRKSPSKQLFQQLWPLTPKGLRSSARNRHERLTHPSLLNYPLFDPKHLLSSSSFTLQHICTHVHTLWCTWLWSISSLA
jgi:hypothetical protein